MNSNIIKTLAVFVAAMLLAQTSFSAEMIELPQEELATESVYPIFERPKSVMNRNIMTKNRIDLNLFYSYAMTEPIASVNKFGISSYYNLNEDHSLGFVFAKNSTGLSDYATQLNKQFGLDFGRAPTPEQTMMLDYNLKAFYGKMSISKNIVFNMSLYGAASIGMIKYSHKSYPGIALGLGQKFYFDKNWALRLDLKLYANQAPIPFLAGKIATTDPTPSPSEFKERLTYTTNLDLGISYLF